MNDLTEKNITVDQAVAITVEHQKLINGIMTKAMQKDVHYGIIPGCGKKPTLLKAGAEIIARTYNIALSHEYREHYHDDEEGNLTVTVISRATVGGEYRGEYIGQASTLEAKNQRLLKSTGQQPPSIYNTVAKMAQKRADVGCIISVTGISDMFTCDLEDMQAERESVENKESKPKADTKPKHSQIWTDSVAVFDKLIAEGRCTKDMIASTSTDVFGKVVSQLSDDEILSLRTKLEDTYGE